MTRTLVVNADDFGASEGVNRGIAHAHVHGIVTSTSLMVTGRAPEHAAELAREHPELGVGLHWTSTPRSAARRSRSRTPAPSATS